MSTADLWEQYPHLSRVNSPADVKAMSKKEIDALAEEIRSYLVYRVTQNGGHLASNLGAVELSIAIHRVFDSPTDHIIFDVGHQSYVHKLITGRREAFDTLRQGGGVSGFPKRSESEHDSFGSGHSSTSLSAALGFAEADHINGSDAFTICVFGDGAYTGGMIHEAINNCRRDLRLIIILNENEMSISKNIGRFATQLSRIRASRGYFKTKDITSSILRHIPLLGKWIINGLVRIKQTLKSVLYGSNYFENLGIFYLGPVDGNDEEAVERLLQKAKESGQSCIIHLKTKKGKGYEPAERTPTAYHGMSPAGKMVDSSNSFSGVMGNTLCQLAREDKRVCAITAAMTEGTGLVGFREEFPDRFFDVGIAEAHAVTFAAGLAANGMRPVVAVYSTFLQRAYDNIIHDVALQNLPVIFCIDRAGLNASDGATHHGIFDVAFLSHIPTLKIYTPITMTALQNAMKDAMQSDCPCAIRYPNGCEDPVVVEAFYGEAIPSDVGVRSYLPTEGEAEAIIITHGRMASESVRACQMLAKRGISAGVLLLEQLKPYDKIAGEVVTLLPKGDCKLLFLEEEIKVGGMGMLLSDALSKYEIMQNKQIDVIALDNSFGVQNQNEPIHTSFGMDAESIVKRIVESF